MAEITEVVNGIEIGDFDNWKKVNEDWARAYSARITNHFHVHEDLSGFRRNSVGNVVHFVSEDRTIGYVFTGLIAKSGDWKKIFDDEMRKYSDIKNTRILREFVFYDKEIAGFYWGAQNG